jgi:hypothetical protein
VPPPQPRPQFPDNAAVASSPFLDAIVAGVAWQNRFSQPINVGAQAGMYIEGRLRLAIRIAVPTGENTDQPGVSGLSSAGYQSRTAADPSFLYGASAGLVVYDTQSFALAPGIAFGRSNVADYGNLLGLSVPLDWVLPSGMRVGMEADLGRAFGGYYRFQCHDTTDLACTNGAEFHQDRPGGNALFIQFQLGFGFDHPAPLRVAPPPP